MKTVNKFNVGGEVVKIRDVYPSGKYIFIGDSYDQYSQWIANTANIMGLTEGVDYWNVAAPGTSMATGTWLGLLQTWVNTHPDDIRDVTRIVCAGGINDSDPQIISALWSQMTTFMQYVRSIFDNAEVYMAYIGWALDTSGILAGRTGEYREQAAALYARSAELGYHYIPGCEMVLHERTLLNADGLHPTAEGGRRIAGALANGIWQGSAEIMKPSAFASFTPVAGTLYGGVRQAVYGDQLFTQFESFHIAGGTYQFGNGAWTDLGAITLPYSNGFKPFVVRVMMTTTTQGNQVFDCEAYVGPQQGSDHLFMRINQTTSSGWVSATVTEIFDINMPVIINAIRN